MKPTWLLYVLAAFASCFLSIFMIQHADIINPDGICYLSSAEAITTRGLQGAMQVCGQAKWPFYSLLITATVTLTGLAYSSAAYFLDTSFSLVMVMFFMLIVRELGGSYREQAYAAVIILFSYTFANIREYIIRDHGFLAFYLVSLWYLLRYFRLHFARYAYGFSISLILATAFRIEGAVFLLALPWLALFEKQARWRKRVRSFLLLNLPLILLMIILASAWLLYNRDSTALPLGRLPELMAQLQHGIALSLNRYVTARNALATHVLSPFAAKNAGLLLGILLIGWYITSIINNLSLGYTLLLVWGWIKHTFSFKPHARLILASYLLLNIAITFSFLSQEFFLSKRYLLALSLVLMLWLPFTLSHMLTQWKKLRIRLLLIVILLLTLAAWAPLLHHQHQKRYLRDAGLFLAQELPQGSKLYANDLRLLYDSQQFGDRIFTVEASYRDLTALNKEKWRQYDYLALRTSPKNYVAIAKIRQAIPHPPLRVFSNQRGSEVVIYRIGATP